MYTFLHFLKKILFSLHFFFLRSIGSLWWKWTTILLLQSWKTFDSHFFTCFSYFLAMKSTFCVLLKTNGRPLWNPYRVLIFFKFKIEINCKTFVLSEGIPLKNIGKKSKATQNNLLFYNEMLAILIIATFSFFYKNGKSFKLARLELKMRLHFNEMQT